MIDATEKSLRTVPVFILIILSIFLNGCMVERQLAGEFISKWEPPSLLVLTPEVVLKENLKTEQVDKRKDLSEWERDSALFFQSIYLKDISDSIFLETYINKFIEGLRSQGYPVYISSNLDSFLALQGQSYVLDIGQILLEEYEIPRTEQEMFDDTITYYKKMDLNAVSISTWFELSQVNTDSAHRKLLYASHYMHDYLKGRFARHPLKGTVTYKYELKPVRLENVYNLAGILGRKYAGWLTDFFMEEYIRSKLPEGLEPEVYYHYDREKGRVERSWGERFRVLESY